MAQSEPARSCGSPDKPGRHWRKRFIETLAATASIERAAAAARVSTARAYQTRRDNTDFARDWQNALADSYLNLELEVIRRLRDGDLLTENGDKCDFANAIRLLAARRDGSGRGQTEVRNVSPAEVRASIDRKIEEIRRRAARQKAAAQGEAK